MNPDPTGAEEDARATPTGMVPRVLTAVAQANVTTTAANDDIDDDPEDDFIQIFVADLDQGARANIEVSLIEKDWPLQFTYVTTPEEWVAAISRRQYHLYILGRTFFETSPVELYNSIKTSGKEPGIELPCVAVCHDVTDIEKGDWIQSGIKDVISYQSIPFLLSAIAERELRSLKSRLEREVYASQINQSRLIDGLTQLPTFEKVGELVAERANVTHSILVIGLYPFQKLRLTLGQTVGDAFLKHVSQSLEAVKMEGVTLGSLSGDRFLLHTPSDDPAHIKLVAHTYQQVFQQPFKLEGVEQTFRSYIGAASRANNEESIDKVLKRALVSLDAAMDQGIYFLSHSEALADKATKRLALMSDLWHAAERGQFFLEYQPKVCVYTNKVMGVEALVRWRHPEHNLISPIDFIPLAEQTKAIRQLTRWVLKQALEDCARWRKLNYHMPVAINFCAEDLLDDETLRVLQDTLQREGLPPSDLNIEITESILLADEAKSREQMEQLQRMGIEFSIDDYGTGYSSLAKLKGLPIAGQALKIDRLFIKDSFKSDIDRVIVSSSIQLAHALKMKVVAEGVEDSEALSELRGMGCDQAQGYFISRPQPFERLIAWLDRGRANEHRWVCPVVPAS